MTMRSTASPIQCANCGASVSDPSITNCPACGAPLPFRAETPQATEVVIKEFIDTNNQTLLKTGTSAAELAFGISCTLGLLISFAALVLTYLAFTKQWTILAVVGFILLLVTFMVASLLGTRAKAATTQSTYRRNIQPEVERFITINHLERQEFIARVDEALPEGAPLRSYLDEEIKPAIPE